MTKSTWKRTFRTAVGAAALGRIPSHDLDSSSSFDTLSTSIPCGHCTIMSSSSNNYLLAKQKFFTAVTVVETGSVFLEFASQQKWNRKIMKRMRDEVEDEGQNVTRKNPWWWRTETVHVLWEAYEIGRGGKGYPRARWRKREPANR